MNEWQSLPRVERQSYYMDGRMDGENGGNGGNSRWGLCLVCTAENYWPGDTGKVIPSMESVAP